MKITAIYKKKKHTVFPIDELVIKDNHGNVFTISEGKRGLMVTKIENKLLFESDEIKVVLE